MSELERTKTTIPCPGGGRSIDITYGDLARKSSVKSSKGHEYKFQSSQQYKFKNALKNLEKAQEQFDNTLSELISKADVLLKR